MTGRAIYQDKTQAWAGRVDELRRHSPEWAAQLAAARTRQELRHIVSRLAMQLAEQFAAQDHAQATLRERIRIFMTDNLHRGLTLKDLSAFLGYSEKYCSELFLKVMGEPFSQWLKRLRIREARRLLADNRASMTDIAESLGFSDQFAFSHFFKKTVGCSPRQFRTRPPKPAAHKPPASHPTENGGQRPIHVKRADVPFSGA
jgi:AraC-like DNA-binding protein